MGEPYFKVKKIIEENDLNASQIKSSRDDGRLVKADVMEHLKHPSKNDKKSIFLTKNEI